MQPRHQATLTKPVQCVSQHYVANPHVSTHMATKHDNNHVAIPLRSATTDSTTSCNYAHTHKHSQSSLKPPFHCGQKKGKPTAAATAAHTRYLSLPPAATLHGQAQGFVLRLPPHNKAHATFMQPLKCVKLNSFVMYCIVM